MKVEARVLQELPSLMFRLELNNCQTVLAHMAGVAERNFVRLRPGDQVEVELSPHDAARGRILKKVTEPRA